MDGKQKGNCNSAKEPSTLWNRLLTVLGVVLCAIWAPILIMNITLIVKSYTHKDQVPLSQSRPMPPPEPTT